MPHPVLSADAVVAAAQEASFSLVGVAEAKALDAAPLTRWLQAGYGAGLAALQRKMAQRLDPGAVVPGARTVIALAIPYQASTQAGPTPAIARYAQGRDYHLTHRDRLRALRRKLLLLDPAINTYACVDAGMAMEKAWAERAGLGWIGKHGILVTRPHGSWLTLSVMIINRALDRYDQPHPRLCGECDLCLRACPTQAFPSPGVVDARRCLSYQTVENHDYVPLEVRPALRGRVLGCDICQEACPFNHAKLPPGDARHEPRPLGLMTAAQIAALGREELRSLAAGTPMARAGADGLLRNAALALAGQPEARPTLMRLSEDAHPLVSEAARWALEK